MPSSNLAVIDMIRRLVAFDTTSRDSNLALIDWVRDYLKKLRHRVQLVFDETGKKANLFATFGPRRPTRHRAVRPYRRRPGRRPGRGRRTRSRWSEKDGRLYGRGTCDMKSFSPSR